MAKYRVRLIWDDGEEEYMDEVFDSYNAAEEAAQYECSCNRSGYDTLNMSNPGDYQEEDFVDVSYEIIEED